MRSSSCQREGRRVVRRGREGRRVVRRGREGRRVVRSGRQGWEREGRERKG